MSKHEIPVIEVKLEKHPGADALSLVRIGGYVVVVRTADWKDGDLAVYIAPDYVCPKNEIFAFLGDRLRIKTRGFRGIIIVVQPLLNRWCPEIGRVKLKIVGNKYLEKS